jgi:hypothetical protein
MPVQPRATGQLRMSDGEWAPTDADAFPAQTRLIRSRLRALRRELSPLPPGGRQRLPAIAAIAPPQERLIAQSGEIVDRLRGLRRGLALARPPRHFRWTAAPAEEEEEEGRAAEQLQARAREAPLRDHTHIHAIIHVI